MRKPCINSQLLYIVYIYHVDWCFAASISERSHSHAVHRVEAWRMVIINMAEMSMLRKRSLIISRTPAIEERIDDECRALCIKRVLEH